MKVLEITNLTKHYGRITAVNQLNLDVEAGQIMGVLGPNGSGKTTTLGIVLGITKCDSGHFQWFGGKYKDSEALQRVGSLLETPNFFPYLAAEDNLKIIAHIKKSPQTDFNHLLELVNDAKRDILDHANHITHSIRQQRVRTQNIPSIERAFTRSTRRYPEVENFYVVFFDAGMENETWKAYNNEYWPHLFLANRQGQIVYDHIGEGAYPETEAKIRQLLGKTA